MIVSNAKHETAIVIRRDGHVAVFVRLKAGKLGCEREAERVFRERWQEAAYPLMETLDRFLAHAQTHGCSQEALKGLEKLKARERYAVASLF
ncbi:MAG: hypothetical protein QM739_11615 [Propionivibrio sp.]